MSKISTTPNLVFTTIILVFTLTTPIFAESTVPSSASSKSDTSDFIDSSEWIPMRQPCLTCHDEQQTVNEDQNPTKTSDQQQQHAQQKSGRVLNTAVAFQRNFLPRQQQSEVPLQTLDKLLFNLPPPPMPNPQNYNPYGQQTHLTPQFLPHLEGANFNTQNVPVFSPNAQRFLPPRHQHQIIQPPPPVQQQQPQYYINQPQDDFHLLQQILNSQNGQFANSIFDVPQSPPINQTQSYLNPTPAELYSTVESVTTPKPTTEKPATTPDTRSSKANEEISLLYVPLETLRQRGPARNKPEVITEKSYQSSQNPSFYQSESQPQSELSQLQAQIQQDYAQQSYQVQQLQNQFSKQNNPRKTLVGIVTTSPRTEPSTTVTPTKKKTKLKPHQPPLAVFMNSDSEKSDSEEVKVTDVLSVLNTARTISVLDQVGPKMPQVFVGPSTLEPPNGYAKFDLPYLSSLDHNRIQRKVEQLPFFVAPLSYNVPDGYSKIPFPSPHVGSVVIRDMKDLHNKQRPEISIPTEEEIIYSNPLLNQFNSNFQIPTFQTQQPKFTSNSYDSTFGQASSVQPPRGETPTRQQQYYSVSTQSPLTPTRQQQYYSESSSQAPFTATRQKQHYSEPTSSPSISNDGALNNYYFTKSTARPENYESKRRPYKIPNNPTNSQQIISSTPASLTDYTILEQFPIRGSQSTTPSGAFKSSTYNFDKYRTQPVGLNEEIVNGANQYQQNSQISQYSPDLSEAHVTQLTQEVQLQPKLPQQNIVSSSTEQPNREVYPQISQKQQQQNLYKSEPGHLQRQPPQQYYQEQIPFSPIPQISTVQPQKYEPQIYQSQPEPQNSFTAIPSPNLQYIQQISSQQPLKTHESQQVESDHSNIQDHTQQYNLSSLLPPINPQLPSLINSLQDERGSSPTPASSIADSHPKSSTQQTTTYETYTRRPVTRGRQRYPSVRPVSTTESPFTTTPRSRGTTPQRRRRPQYNGRPRQENDNSGEQPNYPPSRVTSTTTTTTTTTTASPPTETVVVTTPRVVTRNRYHYQQNTEHTTTELPRRNIVTRTRFRTRGRPNTTTTTPEPPTTPITDNEPLNGHQNNAPLTERISFAFPSTSDNGLQFQQPKLESGFQVSPSVPNQQEYLQNPSQNPIYQQQNLNYNQYNNNGVQQAEENPQQNYYSNQQFQTVPQQEDQNIYQQQQQKETINPGAYSTDNQPSQPAYSSTTPNVKYVDISTYNNKPSSTPAAEQKAEPEVISRPIDGQSIYVRFNGGQQQTALLQHTPTTERISSTTPAARRQNALTSRIRDKSRQRGRVGSYTSTSTETEAVRFPSTTQKATKQEEQEFYGFFRAPSFQAPAANSNDEAETIRSSTIRPQYSLNPSTHHNLNSNYDHSVGSSTSQPRYTNPSTQPQYSEQTESPNKYFSQTASPNKYYSQTEDPNVYYSQSESPQKYYSQTESPQKYYSQTESPQKYYSQTESPQKYYSTEKPSTYYPQTESPQKYYSQTDNPNTYFSQTERASTESADTIYVDSSGRQTSPTSSLYPSYYVENNPSEVNEAQPQSPSPVYVASPSTDKAENIQVPNIETTTAKKPHKQYFISSKVPPTRAVRPTINNPTQYYPSTTDRSNINQAGRYTVRPPTKRVETEPPRVVKIRGRIRKPTSRTTTTTEENFEEEQELIPQQYEEIPSPVAHSEAYTQPKYTEQNVVKTKKRPVSSRGQVSYRKSVGNVGSNSNEDDNDGLEGENYPKAFLQAQELNTKRPDFKITVGPLDQSESSYSDQIPYQSIYRPKVIIKSPEDGVSESQWATKYTTTSIFRKQNSNSNDIPVEDKETFSNEKDVNETSNSSNVSDSSSDNSIATTESKSIFEQIFEEMAKFDMGDESTTTIEAITESNEDDDETIGEIKVRKGKRRGYWKRVRVRPVDGLQVAESQHVVAATNLISDSAKKVYPRPTIEQYVISFEQPEQINDTTIEKVKNTTQDFVTVLPEKVSTNLSEIILDTTNSNQTLIDNITESLISTNVKENVTAEVEKIIETKTESNNDIKLTTETLEIIELNEDVTTENVPITTTVQNQIPDIVTENETNETKVIAEKTNEITKKIEGETQEKKLDISDPFVLGTSTSTEISHETEICYRGRCVKSNTTSTSSENDTNQRQLL